MTQYTRFKRIGAKKIGKITHLLIYPVKSCAPTELRSARVTKRGLETISPKPIRDREYMLVDATPETATRWHKFLTQRDRGLQKMALVTPSVRNDKLELSFEGQDRIEIPDIVVGKELPVRVHAYRVTGVDQGDQIARMLSDYLNRPIRLVRASGSFSRSTSQHYVKNDNTLSYQDAYSVNWLYEESVAELQNYLSHEISYLNFRPNFVASGGAGNSEHAYYHVRLDGVEGFLLKPSTRCMIPNIDHKNGKMLNGKRLPLQVIYENYNWIDKDGQRQAIFAENFLPSNEGKIHKSGEIEVLSLRDPPLHYGKVRTSSSSRL